MLGHRRLADSELAADRLRQLARRPFPVREQLEQSSSDRVAEDVECVHHSYISLNTYISQDANSLDVPNENDPPGGGSSVEGLVGDGPILGLSSPSTRSATGLNLPHSALEFAQEAVALFSAFGVLSHHLLEEVCDVVAAGVAGITHVLAVVVPGFQ